MSSDVSILVLVDVSPEDDGHEISYGAGTRFNPCSRGCFARRHIVVGTGPGSRVSILVLVDVSPEGLNYQ